MPESTQTPEAPSKPRIEFCRDRITRAPSAIVDVVKQIIAQRKADDYQEKRQHLRYTLGLPGTVMPLDERFEPLSDGFEVVVRDLSTGGAGLYHTRSITAPFLALQIQVSGGKSLKMIGQVMRCRAQGRLYEVGCRFVAKIED